MLLCSLANINLRKVKKRMMNFKRLSAILTTAIMISLMALSMVAVSNGEIENWNPNMDTTSTYNTYMSSDNSALAAASQYGDLLNEDYAWTSWLCNGPERTGFNPGPAPDRPDIIWMSTDIPDLGGPVAGQIAFGGKLFLASVKYLENETDPSQPLIRTEFVNALDPFTGQII